MPAARLRVMPSHAAGQEAKHEWPPRLPFRVHNPPAGNKLKPRRKSWADLRGPLAWRVFDSESPALRQWHIGPPFRSTLPGASRGQA